MHSPHATVANQARANLGRIYIKFLKRVCGAKVNTPAAILLMELALSPLQMFWWHQALSFFNDLATCPAAKMFHMILLDNTMLFIMAPAILLSQYVRGWSLLVTTCPMMLVWLLSLMSLRL